MGSNALADLLSGLTEIDALQRANPTPREKSGLKKPAIVRAIGRSEIVLLSSHFERYIYALTEEAIDFLCESRAKAESLPNRLKLEHSKHGIDAIAAVAWEKRGDHLIAYSANESWLWNPQATIGPIDSSRLLAWMKTPKPQALVRVFKIWGIEDIFSSITRTAVHRGRLRLRIEELVTKRNNIAHGDFTVEATYHDIMHYMGAVKMFCTRADAALARQLMSITGRRPW